ncbi:MAG TPA: peptidyl-tRNA hydrolase Pth2 [Methanocorpusculum sp.]|nr:peptidyl-tRNA hydrolase Pth2 [Methanocorpusculum sp.]
MSNTSPRMTGGKDVFKYKQCLILRADLKLSCGKMCAQAAHASIGAFKKSSLPDRIAWMREGQKKVVLKAQGERVLYELKSTAEIQGLPVSLIIDAGYTEVPPGTVTALGIGPAKAELIDKVTGNLPLL